MATGGRGGAIYHVTTLAGAGSGSFRDAVDRRLIGELTSLGKRGKTLPHTDDRGEALAGGLGEVVGGPAPPESDGDGIPDGWETAHGLNPRNAADAGGLDSSGYSQLEVYLNSLARM